LQRTTATQVETATVADEETSSKSQNIGFPSRSNPTCAVRFFSQFLFQLFEP